MNWTDGTNPYAGASTPQKGYPSILPIAEATDWIEEIAESSVLLGVDGTGEPVTVDLDSESPHILVSARTGAGKSAIARSIAVQRLCKGDIVSVLDVKRHSHRWAKKLAPNVHYAPTVQDVGFTLVQVGRELHRRNVVVDEWDGPVETAPVGPRIVIVFEEMNATMRQLKDLDKRLPDGNYRATDALADISFMGRAVKIHLVSFAQMATYRASGGSEIVECYGTRILVKYSPQAWRYLASDCGRAITAPEEVGRGMVCQDGKAKETQLLWITEEQSIPMVTRSLPAQRRARKLTGALHMLPPVWRGELTS